MILTWINFKVHFHKTRHQIPTIINKIICKSNLESQQGLYLSSPGYVYLKENNILTNSLDTITVGIIQNTVVPIIWTDLLLPGVKMDYFQEKAVAPNPYKIYYEIHKTLPESILSLAPSLVNTLSTGVSLQLSAGTQQPSCAMTTIRPACLISVDLPPMLGPVTKTHEPAVLCSLSLSSCRKT